MNENNNLRDNTKYVVNISYSHNHKVYNPESSLPSIPYKRDRKSIKHREKAKFTDRIIISTAVDRNNTIFITVSKIGTTSLL